MRIMLKQWSRLIHTLWKHGLLWIFESLFGCHHQHLSRVFTIRGRTYQACFECGQEFEYSWAMMHSIRSNVADNAFTPLSRRRGRVSPEKPLLLSRRGGRITSEREGLS